MTDDDRRSEQLLDLLVYMPIGLALEAKELLPKLADRGRGQVALTRLAGKVASAKGQSEARKVFDQVTDVVETLLTTDDPAEPAAPTSPTVVDTSDLPIAGYDELTAAKVLPKLKKLSAGDLATVLAYEQSHRSRATVINRIRQLQG